VRTINTGIIAAESTALRRWLSQLSNSNAQGEYYLTDVFAFAAHEYTPAEMALVADAQEAEGANDPGSCRSWSVPGSVARCVRCARRARACATRHDWTSVAPSPWAATC
jgi:bifunctional UDP-N-acetylglucosamine pyrophosphorylase/glucosamine-1-phosphate N-acetyltransferase